MSAPEFEVVADHEFKPKERVLMIDPNGYDLWEANIESIEDNEVGGGKKYSVHYPEFPDDDETVPDTSRILVRSNANMRIFRQQEMIRSQQLPVASSGEEPADESEDSERGEDYKPSQGDNLKAKKPAKAGKKKKPAKGVHPRPEGCRSNPPRGGRA